jgi:hypothetical protein
MEEQVFEYTHSDFLRNILVVAENETKAKEKLTNYLDLHNEFPNYGWELYNIGIKYSESDVFIM